MNKIKLKRCPFCGGEAKICGYYFIQCVKCGSSTLTHTDRESAINTWNTRIPTVEAKPVVHGEWDKYRISKLFNYTCTVCHCDVDEKTPYCPWCGAKMENKNEEKGMEEH